MRNTSARRRRSSPAFDALEGRGLLSSTTNLPWPDPGHLTLSFAPDGTSVGGAPSALYQTLGTRLAGPVWQNALARAFQSWAAQANINIGVVSDNGQAAGQFGTLEGKLGMGDIRLTARPLGESTLAITTPFDLFNAWSGTVVFNSNAPFADGNGATQDLFAAALHEAGHAFGLGDSTDPTSAMYGVAIPGRAGPSAADVAALQALYGRRQADASEGWFGNDFFFQATRLGYLANPADAGAATAAIEADLTSSTDRDTYLVTTPLNATTPTSISVRAAGLSLVMPRVTVFDLLGQPVATASAVDPLRNDLALTVPVGLPGSSFYVRVEAAQPGVFGIGSYRIAAGAGGLAATAAAPTGGSSRGVADDGGRNDSLNRATTLRAATAAADSRWTYTVRAGISAATDVDYYRFRTEPNTPPVLVVSVGGVQASGLTPRVDVFDRGGNPLPVQILNHDGGSYTVQVPHIDANTWYVARVAALDPAGPNASGRYFLGIDVRDTALPLVGFAYGALQGSGTPTLPVAQDCRTLSVTRSTLFHFELSASGGGADGSAALRATLYDAQGRPVFSLRALNGAEPAGGNVLLGPGTYTMRFVAANRTGTPLPLLFYNLRGLIRSDPVGPTPVDTTVYPITPPTGQNPVDPFYWINLDPAYYAAYLTLADPFSNPWAY